MCQCDRIQVNLSPVLSSCSSSTCFITISDVVVGPLKSDGSPPLTWNTLTCYIYTPQEDVWFGQDVCGLEINNIFKQAWYRECGDRAHLWSTEKQFWMTSLISFTSSTMWYIRSRCKRWSSNAAYFALGLDGLSWCENVWGSLHQHDFLVYWKQDFGSTSGNALFPRSYPKQVGIDIRCDDEVINRRSFI